MRLLFKQRFLSWFDSYDIYDEGGNTVFTDGAGVEIMRCSKELFHWTDVYTLDIPEPRNALLSLMIVLAIDAAKCSSGNG